MTVHSEGLVAAVLKRDITASLRAGGAWFHALFFFGVFVGFVAFSLGPDRDTLQPLAGALIWLAGVLSVQLSTAEMFRQDDIDGTIRIIAAEEQELASYVATRAFSTWLTSILPVAVASPIFLMMFGAAPGEALRIAIVFVIGSPALVLAGLVAAALNAGMKTSGFFSSFLSAPMVIPVLIFGAGASDIAREGFFVANPALLILCALTLALLVIAPLFSTWALRLTLE